MFPQMLDAEVKRAGGDERSGFSSKWSRDDSKERRVQGSPAGKKIYERGCDVRATCVKVGWFSLTAFSWPQPTYAEVSRTHVVHTSLTHITYTHRSKPS